MSNQVNDDGFAQNDKKKNIIDLVKANYIPGITVALVSLPLSTALAIAAGAEPM